MVSHHKGLFTCQMYRMNSTEKEKLIIYQICQIDREHSENGHLFIRYAELIEREGTNIICQIS